MAWRNSDEAPPVDPTHPPRDDTFPPKDCIYCSAEAWLVDVLPLVGVKKVQYVCNGCGKKWTEAIP